MGFTASLHPLSLSHSVHAAAVRTPQRIAVVEGERALSYVTLMNLVDEGKTGSSR